jgi:hypothetical protein
LSWEACDLNEFVDFFNRLAHLNLRWRLDVCIDTLPHLFQCSLRITHLKLGVRLRYPPSYNEPRFQRMEMIFCVDIGKYSGFSNKSTFVDDSIEQKD